MPSFISGDQPMNIFKVLSAMLVNLINIIDKAFNKTLPMVGSTTFYATKMVNDTVKAAASEQDLEHKATMRDLKEAYKLDKKDWDQHLADMEY
jgi:hypothetical protein